VALDRVSEIKALELTLLDTPSERTAQLRGYLAAYTEMGRIIGDIVSHLERMEDAKRKSELRARPVGTRSDRTWGSPYRE